MTTRQRRRCANHIRRVRNLCGHEAAAQVFKTIYERLMYWDYDRARLTGILLEDTRGRGIVVNL